MSGETQEKESGWTVDTLHSHFIRLIELRDKLAEERDRLYAERDVSAKVAMAAALAAAKEAVAKAEVAAEKRFDSQNEFRSQLSDQASTFLPRSEGEIRIQRNSERIDEVVERLSQIEGRGTGSSEKAAIYRMIGIAVAMMVMSLLSITVTIVIAIVV